MRGIGPFSFVKPPLAWMHAKTPAMKRLPPQGRTFPGQQRAQADITTAGDIGASTLARPTLYRRGGTGFAQQRQLQIFQLG